MAYIVKKNIGGKDYFYLRKSIREGEKVKSIDIAYLGKTKTSAEKKAKEIIKSIEKQKNKMEDKKLKLEKKDITIEELATFCKRKGFVYQSGEIYGGLSGFWDYGPLGSELKKNIKEAWWKYHVYQREDIVGIDGAIITNPKIWEASGHIENFIDVVVTDKKTGKQFKIDAHEVEEYKKNDNFEIGSEFNPMFSTNVGPNLSKGSTAYLRPETAQLIFSNFKFVQENARMKLPFGIAQMGKSFRNEIAPRDFLFRSREFEQMEIEYFIRPGEKCPYKILDEEVNVYPSYYQEQNKEPIKMKIKDAFNKKIIKKDWHAYWLSQELRWFRILGADMNKFRIRQHLPEEKSHYATDTWDLEYNFPFGWKELEGIADRGDYDLSKHQEFSKKDLSIFDSDLNKKILPHVVCEPSLGVERAFLVFLLDSYYQDKEKDNIVLKINPKIAPIKAAVFPIVKKPEFEKIAEEVFNNLKKSWNVIYDKSGSIGRRYARNDESSTPFCITIDEESLKNNDVTIRERDSSKQIRIKINNLRSILRDLIDGEIEFDSIK